MGLDIGKEVANLQRMTMKELRGRFAEAFGENTHANNKAWLVKRIAWRLQALAEGDLSERARRRAAELANDADLRVMAPREKKATPVAPEPPSPAHLSDDPRLPMPGAMITKKYKGRLLTVKVLANGFEYIHANPLRRGLVVERRLDRREKYLMPRPDRFWWNNGVFSRT